MKRRDVIQHLEAHGCEFLREGAKHTMFVNRLERTVSALPRHTEISNVLVKKICRDLKIPAPSAS